MSCWHYLMMPTYLPQMFNIKMLQYENGCVEIRTYTDVVGNKPINMPEELLVVKQQVAKAHNKLKTHTVYNPFCEEEMGLYDLDEIEIADARKKHSMRNSYSRTVQKVYSCARQCNWKYFITLTFAPYVVDRYDFSACMKKARKWFDNQKQRSATDLQYLIVPEMHKDGAWHIHGLLAQCEGLRLAFSEHYHHSGRKAYYLADWDYGFNYVVEVDDVDKVSGYITKYITKDLCMATEGKRRYFRSNNIPVLVEDCFLVEGNEKHAFPELLADSLGVVKVYEKEISGYTGVKYQYFKSEV